MQNKFRSSASRRALVVFSMALLLGACSAQKSVDELIGEASKQTQSGNLAGSAVLLKQAIEQQPQAWQPRSTLGDLLVRMGSIAEARVEFDKAIELGGPTAELVPKLIDAMLALGQGRAALERFSSTDLKANGANAQLKASLAEAQIGLGNLGEARRLIDAALVLDAKNGQARLLQARLMAGSRDYDRALQIVSDVSRDLPDLVDAKQLQAELLWTVKSDVGQAERVLRDIIERRPDYIAAYGTLMSILAVAQRFDDYAAVLEILKKRYPRSPAHYFFETRLQLAKKNNQQARESAQELLKLMPEHALSLQLAGVVDQAGGFSKLAEAKLGKALQLEPSLVIARQTLAQILIGRGQARQAVDLLRPLLEREAPDVKAVMLAGEANLVLGDYVQAERNFALAAKLDPSQSEATTALAVLDIGRGRRDAGYSRLEEIARNDKTTHADLALLSVSIRQGDYGKALQVADRLADKMPGSAMPGLLRGRVLLASGDAAAAKKQFQATQDKFPADFQLTTALVDLEVAEGKPADAKRRLDALLKKDPKDYRVHMLLAAVDQRLGAAEDVVAASLQKAIQLSANDPAPRIALAEYALSKRKNQLAKDIVQVAQPLYPDDPLLLGVLGKVLVANGEHQQAIGYLTKAVKSRPDDPRAVMTLADAYVGKGDPAAAQQALGAAVELMPESVTLRARLLAIATKQGRLADVAGLAKRLQSNRPESAAGWVLESEVLEARNELDKALASARLAIQKPDGASNSVRVYYLSLRTVGAASADEFARGWLKSHPKDAELLRFLGERALQTNDVAAAEAHFSKLVEIQPKDALALNNLAWVQLKSNKAAALENARRAAAIAPGSVPILDTLADALGQNGKLEEAVGVRRQIVALAPAVGTHRLKLARVLATGGDRAGAKATLAEHLKDQPNAPDRAAIEQQLKALD